MEPLFFKYLYGLKHDLRCLIMIQIYMRTSGRCITIVPNTWTIVPIPLKPSTSPLLVGKEQSRNSDARADLIFKWQSVSFYFSQRAYGISCLL